MRQRVTVALLISFLSVSIFAKADEHPSRRGWYVGVEAGIPFSAASFSSFAPGGPYSGWTTGLLAGYNFNDFFGLEADLGLGRSSLAARQGCIDNNYYLGADDILYYSAPLGMDSWSVADLKTRMDYQRLGISASVNLLGFIPSRWNLSLSPRISFYHTSPAICSLEGNNVLRPAGKGGFHFGYGGAILLGCQISSLFHIGLSSGITALTGNALDGIPAHGHKANLIWENSIRLCINLSSKKRKTAAPASQYSSPMTIPLPAPSAEISVSSADMAVSAPQQSLSLSQRPGEHHIPECQFVYFEFDKSDLRESESAKLDGILEAMLSDADLILDLEGWSDFHGSDELCEAISRRRAESVKQWFVGKGIAAERIEAEGKGRDNQQKNGSLARRVKVEARLKSSLQIQQ